MGRVIHFEITADDVERAKKFYSDVFGWEMQDAGMPDMAYWLVMTGKQGADIKGRENDGIDGAIMPRNQEIGIGGSNAFICTISVDNIEDCRQKIEDCGGSLLTDIGNIPGIGRHTYCRDTEGNKFGILQTEQGGSNVG